MKYEIETKVVDVPINIEVVDDVTLAKATQEYDYLSQLLKKAKEFFAPMVTAALNAHREATARRDEVIDAIEERRKSRKSAIIQYQHKLEEARLQEQKKLEEQLKKQQEEEMLKQAIQLEEQGLPEVAQQILETPPPTPAVVLPPIQKNVVSRKVWKFKIDDETKIPREYLMVDTVKIGQVVRAMKDQTNIPGVAPYYEEV